MKPSTGPFYEALRESGECNCPNAIAAQSIEDGLTPDFVEACVRPVAVSAQLNVVVKSVFYIADISPEDCTEADLEMGKQLLDLLAARGICTVNELDSDSSFWFAFLAQQLVENKADTAAVEDAVDKVGVLKTIQKMDLNTAFYCVYQEC